MASNSRHAKAYYRAKRHALWVAQYGLCAYCYQPLEPHQATLDEIVPKAKGGRRTINNQIVACKHCNGAKAATDPELFKSYLTAGLPKRGANGAMMRAYARRWHNIGAKRICGLERPAHMHGFPWPSGIPRKGGKNLNPVFALINDIWSDFYRPPPAEQEQQFPEEA